MWTRYSNITFNPHSVHYVKFVLTNQYNTFGCIRFQLSKTVVENATMQTMDIDEDTYPNKPSLTFSVHFQWWKRPSGVAAVCLGLLCVLLLAGILGMFVYYGVIDHHYLTERNQQASYSLLTKERDQSQKEKDQLQTSYNTLTKERDQLQTSYNTLTKERDQLQKSLATKTKEKDQLHNSLTTQTQERDQLQNSLNKKSKERDQLQNSLNTRTTERDQLQNNLNTRTTERDQLQNVLTTRTKDRDQQQNSLKVMIAERDQLKNSLNSRTKERDQLQNSLTTKTKDKDQLQNKLTTITLERDQLQTRLRFYEKPCLDGWWKFGTSCYYVSSTMKGAANGQKECRTMGADLVIINSKEEQVIDNTLVIL
ncbi:centrosomal protein of 135 kDa-like [Salvelinus alpinus]|uniref:centrosomal protein of 135 kDa-like n=1 Tax=Salvelinus alpinus TaxID=8036 RepID=UPI0039FDD739